MRRFIPRTFQARLTLAFVGVVALTLTLVFVAVLNRVDDYFYRQQLDDLANRALTVRGLLGATSNRLAGDRPVVRPDNTLDPAVAAYLTDAETQRLFADQLAQADVDVAIGQLTVGSDGIRHVVPVANGTIRMALEAQPARGQARDAMVFPDLAPIQQNDLFTYGLEVRLSNPYTYRASTVAAITGLLLFIGMGALALSLIVAALLARRFTTPLRRLTEAARGLTEGDLTRRVGLVPASSGSTELAALSRQFDQMAARLEESVRIVRRDRDRSRDFLADVSHELRTPIAALLTFNELLLGTAGADPDTRAEFLESSHGQLERLDWLAQNLLDLSKLDSGLVLLDLRPDDLRGAIESAVEQAEPTAVRRGIALSAILPDRPLRLRHDPPRIGQVVTNLIGNALKFTPRGGTVTVELRPSADGGGRIEVRDTGVGIDAAELPHIFDRFYRGSLANEARGSGSGLGLSIVKSIVDMHAGRVTVDSRLGVGSTFVVTLPRDPRITPDEADEADVTGEMSDSSPPEPSSLNTGRA